MTEVWNTQSKHSSNFTDKPFGSSGNTWNEANFTWNEAGPATWNDPIVWQDQSKHSSTFVNKTRD